MAGGRMHRDPGRLIYNDEIFILIQNFDAAREREDLLRIVEVFQPDAKRLSRAHALRDAHPLPVHHDSIFGVFCAADLMARHPDTILQHQVDQPIRRLAQIIFF